MMVLNCANTYDLTGEPASIFDKNTMARHFDTINDILRSLSLEQYYFKGLNALIWRQRETFKLGDPKIKHKETPELENFHFRIK